MNCRDARQHWNLYHDSEGDAELHFAISEHLRRCAACAEWFGQQSRLENLLTDKLAVQPPTQALWSKVLAASVATPARRLDRRLIVVVGIAATAASLLIGWMAWRGPQDRVTAADLSGLAARWHDHLISGVEPVAFRSGSDRAVEDFLRKEVAFPVRCPPRRDAGFAVEGAGAGRVEGQAAAYLVGRVEQVQVSVFILSRDSLAAFPQQHVALRKDRVYHCREGQYEMAMSIIDRNVVLVVGQTQPERLKQVLNAYGSYPHDQAS